MDALLSEVLLGFGNILANHQRQTANTLITVWGHSRPALRKRATLAVGHLVACLTTSLKLFCTKSSTGWTPPRTLLIAFAHTFRSQELSGKPFLQLDSVTCTCFSSTLMCYLLTWWCSMSFMIVVQTPHVLASFHLELVFQLDDDELRENALQALEASFFAFQRR